MKKQQLLLALLFPWLCCAQYPFEKFKAIKFKEYNDWKTIEGGKDSMPIFREITITDFDKKTPLKITQDIKISPTDSTGYMVLKVYRADKMIKEFEVKSPSIYDPLALRVEDVNGDGRKDIKIVFPNIASGGYNYYCDAVYLFQNKDGSFIEVKYTDIFEEYDNKPERDFNNDGQYEIITQTFQNYGKHNYWVFNIYNYKNGKLVNVNQLADYPIMIPLDSYQVSKKIPREKMKKYAIKAPEMQW